MIVMDSKAQLTVDIVAKVAENRITIGNGAEALGVDISAGGVRSMWLRNNLNTTALRVERSQALQETA
jgi:hypothetical protein